MDFERWSLWEWRGCSAAVFARPKLSSNNRSTTDQQPTNRRPQVSETPLLSVHSAMRAADPARNRAWKVKNPNVINPITGQPVGFKLVPTHSTPMLMQPESLVAKRAFFATKHLFVTPHHDEQVGCALDVAVWRALWPPSKQGLACVYPVSPIHTTLTARLPPQPDPLQHTKQHRPTRPRSSTRPATTWSSPRTASACASGPPTTSLWPAPTPSSGTRSGSRTCRGWRTFPSCRPRLWGSRSSPGGSTSESRFGWWFLWWHCVRLCSAKWGRREGSCLRA